MAKPFFAYVLVGVDGSEVAASWAMDPLGGPSKRVLSAVMEHEREQP